MLPLPVSVFGLSVLSLPVSVFGLSVLSLPVSVFGLSVLSLPVSVFGLSVFSLSVSVFCSSVFSPSVFVSPWLILPELIPPVSPVSIPLILESPELPPLFPEGFELLLFSFNPLLTADWLLSLLSMAQPKRRKIQLTNNISFFIIYSIKIY